MKRPSAGHRVIVVSIAVLAVLQAVTMLVVGTYIRQQQSIDAIVAEQNFSQFRQTTYGRVYSSQFVIDPVAKRAHIPELDLSMPYSNPLRDLRYLYVGASEDRSAYVAVTSTRSLMGPNDGQYSGKMCLSLATVSLGPINGDDMVQLVSELSTAKGQKANVYRSADTAAECDAFWDESLTPDAVAKLMSALQ